MHGKTPSRSTIRNRIPRSDSCSRISAEARRAMTLDQLVRAAARGDQAAWNELVERFQGLVWATARAHRLSRTDAADVAQTVWLRLVENLDRIREPEHLGGWLAKTARRESLRFLRLNGRELP